MFLIYIKKILSWFRPLTCDTYVMIFTMWYGICHVKCICIPLQSKQKWVLSLIVISPCKNTWSLPVGFQLGFTITEITWCLFLIPYLVHSPLYRKQTRPGKMKSLAQGHISEWLETWSRSESNFLPFASSCLSCSWFYMYPVQGFVSIWQEMSINKVINLGFIWINHYIKLLCWEL